MKKQLLNGKIYLKNINNNISIPHMNFFRLINVDSIEYWRAKSESLTIRRQHRHGHSHEHRKSVSSVVACHH